MKTWGETTNGLRFHYPSKTYYINAKVNGKAVSKSTGTNIKAQALAFKDNHLAVLRKPVKPDDAEQAAKLANLTLAPYIAEYRRLIAVEPLAPLTRGRKEHEIRYVEQHWQTVKKTALAAAEPRKLARVDLIEFQAGVRDLGYCPDVINRWVRVVGVLLEAVEADIPGFVSPFRGKPFKRLKQARKPRLELPTDEEFRQIVTWLRDETINPARDEIADLAEALAYTGLRIDEARSLRARHVHLDDGLIRVTADIAKGHKLDAHAQATVVREIPLFGEAPRRLFARLVSNPAPDGGLFRVISVNRALARACTALGLAKLTNHKLRHLFATLALEKTNDPKLVASWLGHSEKDGGKLVFEIYTHLRAARSKEIAAKVNFDWSQPQQKVA